MTPFQLNRVVEVVPSLGYLIQAGVGPAAIRPCVFLPGVEFDQPVASGQGLCMSTKVVQRPRLVYPGPRVLGVEVTRAVMGREGFRMPTKFVQSVSFVYPCVG